MNLMVRVILKNKTEIRSREHLYALKILRALFKLVKTYTSTQSMENRFKSSITNFLTLEERLSKMKRTR